MATKKKPTAKKVPPKKKLTQHQWDLVLDARHALDERCADLQERLDDVSDEVNAKLEKVVKARKIGVTDVVSRYAQTIEANRLALQKAIEGLEEGVEELDHLLDSWAV